MNRRRLLSASAIALGAAAWPAFIRDAFAADACDNTMDTKRSAKKQAVADVAEAFRRAQRAGKPLLVLVIPKRRSDVWDRGHAFGELLNHGGTETMALVSLAEVLCARTEALRALMPAGVAGEPLMFVVETDRVPAEVEPLDAELPRLRDGEPPRSEDPVALRIATLTKLLRRGLARDRQMIRRRADQSRAMFSASELTVAEKNAEHADRVAAMVYERAASSLVRDGTPLLYLLAAGATRRLRQGRVSGASWASSGGCGVDFEDPAEKDRNSLMKCGMGYVPEKSRRFLYLLSREDERTGGSSAE